MMDIKIITTGAGGFGAVLAVGEEMFFWQSNYIILSM